MQPGVVVSSQEFNITGLYISVGFEQEALCCHVEQAILDRDQCAVVDVVRRQVGQFLNFLLDKQPHLQQVANADEHLVAGKGRQRLVRRIAVSRWSGWQKLPDAQLHGLHRVNERASRSADLANTIGAWQRRDVQAHAGPLFGRQGLGLRTDCHRQHMRTPLI